MQYEGLKIRKQLSLFKSFKLLKQTFYGWKNYTIKHKIRALQHSVRIENIVDFFERNQEKLKDRVFNAWKQHIRMRQLRVRQRKFQYQRRCNAWESLLKVKVFQQVEQSFCRMLKVHLAAKVIEQWALIIHEDNVKKQLSDFVRGMVQLKEETQERSSFYDRYHQLQLQNRYFKEWSQLAKITEAAKKMRYYAFEGRRLKLQMKAFLCLRRNQVVNKHLKLRFNVVNEQRKHKLKQKFLYSWIKVCVQNYQASSHYQNLMLQRGFQILKLWMTWSKTQRYQSQQAIIHYLSRKAYTTLHGWRNVIDRKTDEKIAIITYRNLQTKQLVHNLMKEWSNIARRNNRKRLINIQADAFLKKLYQQKPFKSWIQFTEIQQKKYLRTYNRGAVCKKFRLRLFFSQWNLYVERKQQYSVLEQQLIQDSKTNRAVQVFRIFNSVISQLMTNTHKAKQHLQFKSFIAVFGWLKLNRENKKRIKNKIDTFQSDNTQKILSQVYFQWKNISRRLKQKKKFYNMATEHFLSQIITKTFRQFRRFSKNQIKMRLLNAKSERRTLETTLVKWAEVWEKETQIKLVQKIDKNRLLNLAFQSFLKYRNKQQYRKYAVQYNILRSEKRTMKQTFNQILLYQRYSLRKKHLNVSMIRLHYVKFLKRFFNQFKKMINRKHSLQSKAEDLLFLQEFRLKRTFFQKVMLHIISPY